jgi:hypothetical protein
VIVFTSNEQFSLHDDQNEVMCLKMSKRTNQNAWRKYQGLLDHTFFKGLLHFECLKKFITITLESKKYHMEILRSLMKILIWEYFLGPISVMVDPEGPPYQGN